MVEESSSTATADTAVYELAMMAMRALPAATERGRSRLPGRQRNLPRFYPSLRP